MLGSVLHALLGVILVGSAVAKLAAPAQTQAALATFGLGTARRRLAAWCVAVALELALGVAVALGSDVASVGAAALMAGFALLLVSALRSGAKGRPCGCLGPRSRVSARAAVRTALLAAAFALLPLVPDVDPSADAWLAASLGVALAAVAALAVLVLALAREVGELRLAIGSQAALEIPGEGPQLGVRSDVIERFAPGPRARHALAIFSSPGCPLCQALAPAVELLERDPLLAIARFDEHADADVWRALEIPGSPYAVALALDGTVLAQGTFNSLPQLESLVATAAARERELAHA